jgi:hypothetical protein
VIHIIILAITVFLCAPTSSTTVIYSFKCKSNDANSTMTYDGRLNEPRLEESGYTSGYQTGTFSYLQDGRIDFRNTINYYDGNSNPNSNSFVFHNMAISFEGKKGISEFYGKGFFPNNRAIFSMKAIRFEELGRYSLNNYSNLGNSYSSNKIGANAKLFMGQTRKMDLGYDFTYNATVINGVVETRDIMGWSNRTGARRVDWEQMARMKGNITLENNLLVSNLLDMSCSRNWLSCSL